MKSLSIIGLALLLLFGTAGIRMGQTSQIVGRQAIVVEAGDLHLTDDDLSSIKTAHWFNDQMIALKPDAIILNSDAFINTKVGSADSVRAYMSDSIGRRYPVYLTVGNHDHGTDIYQAAGVLPTAADSANPYLRVRSVFPDIPYSGAYVVIVGNQKWILFPDQWNGIAEKCSTSLTAAQYYNGYSGNHLFQPVDNLILSGQFGVSGSYMFNFIQKEILNCTQQWLFLASSQGRWGLNGTGASGRWHWQQMCAPGHAFARLIEDTRTLVMGTAGKFFGPDAWFTSHNHSYGRRGPTRKNIYSAGKTSVDSFIVEINGPPITGTHAPATAAWDSTGGTAFPDTCRTTSVYTALSDNDSIAVTTHWTPAEQVMSYKRFAGAGTGIAPGYNLVETNGLTLRVTCIDSTGAVIDRWGQVK